MMFKSFDPATHRILQIRIEDVTLAAIINRTLCSKEIGGIRKLGSAPRSGLERAAQEILDKLNK